MAKGWIVDRFFRTKLNVNVDDSTDGELTLTLELLDQEDAPANLVARILVRFTDDAGVDVSGAATTAVDGTIEAEGASFCIVETDATGVATVTLESDSVTDVDILFEISVLDLNVAPYASVETLIAP